MTKNTIIGVALGLLVSTIAAAQKPVRYEAASATETATVEKIDHEARSITLKTSDGRSVAMDVGPEVARFNEIKKGDKVKVDYLVSVGVAVRSPHDTISAAEGTATVIVRNKTKHPSGTMAETEVVTATVDKIDAKARKAVLRGPSGETIHIDVAPDVENLENVRKGDVVVVTVTRTVAVSIRKP